MANKGMKKYKVEHFFHDYFVTIEIDWDKEPPYDCYTNMQSMIHDSATFWSDCPDKHSQSLTDDQLEYFLGLHASMIIYKLAASQYRHAPELCDEFTQDEEGFIPFSKETGIRVVDVEGVEMPSAGEFNIEKLGD